MEKKFNGQIPKSLIETGRQHDKAAKKQQTNAEQLKNQSKRNKKDKQKDKKQQVQQVREEQIMKLEEKKCRMQAIEHYETQNLLDILILGEIIGRPRCKRRANRKNTYTH